MSEKARTKLISAAASALIALAVLLYLSRADDVAARGRIVGAQQQWPAGDAVRCTGEGGEDCGESYSCTLTISYHDGHTLTDTDSGRCGGTGGDVTVYYDPDDPGSASLCSPFVWPLIVGGAGLALLGYLGSKVWKGRTVV